MTDIPIRSDDDDSEDRDHDVDELYERVVAAIHEYEETHLPDDGVVFLNSDDYYNLEWSLEVDLDYADQPIFLGTYEVKPDELVEHGDIVVAPEKIGDLEPTQMFSSMPTWRHLEQVAVDDMTSENLGGRNGIERTLVRTTALYELLEDRIILDADIIAAEDLAVPYAPFEETYAPGERVIQLPIATTFPSDYDPEECVLREAILAIDAAIGTLQEQSLQGYATERDSDDGSITTLRMVTCGRREMQLGRVLLRGGTFFGDIDDSQFELSMGDSGVEEGRRP